jgi:S-formylglutathione hydrolase FrmB
MGLIKRLSIGIVALLVTTLLVYETAFRRSYQSSKASQLPLLKETKTEDRSQENRVQYGLFPSRALGHELNYAVQLPASYNTDQKRRYPVLYFLHGLHGSENDFEKRGIADAVTKMRAEKKIGEFIIVAPNGENSFYLNAKNGTHYEDAIVKDLIPHIDQKYRTIPTANGRAIQGISMGGFGALTIAFKYPQLFSSVSAHSAALFAEIPSPNSNDRRSQMIRHIVGDIFGNPPDVELFKANNPIYLAQSNANSIRKANLKIYFDVGDKDRYGLQTGNKILDEQLDKAGIEHEFNIFPGDHGWEYMLSVGDNSYKFLWKSFKL